MERRSFIISPEADGMKAADLLRRLLPDLPESTFRKLFASRDVRLDGVRISRDAQVHTGQTLLVFLPPSSGQVSPLRIVYEDEDILLVNKPAGISVEPDHPGAVSLAELCRIHVGAEGSDSFFPAACHRLDNKTSGLCLFAKKEDTLAILQDAFRQRMMEKYYTCLVRGMIKPPSAVCSAWLRKDAKLARVWILDHQEPGARPITTGYETLECGSVSRLKVHLITGRTHQIRAHLAALGHPILGDDLYGDRDFNRLHKTRSLRLCATSLCLFTGGRLPQLDGRTFEIIPPF